MASDDEKRRIVVFSDGCVDDRDALEEDPELDAMDDESVDGQSTEDNLSTDDSPLVGKDVRWIQVGQSLDNVGITTFQVRRSTVDPIGYSLLVEIKNFSEDAVETRLTLNLDDTLVDVIPLEIEPGESFRKQIDSTSRAGGVLTGKLKIEDALALDNDARAILPERPEIPVNLVTADDSESYYLRRVLESIPLVRIIDADSESAASLTIFAGVVPEQIPDGPVLFVDLPGPGPEIAGVDDGAAAQPAWQIGESIENPIIAKQEKQSPLLRHVQLQNVILAGGRDLEVNEALGSPTVLLETASGARVCVAVERSEGRILMLASDLDTSDLPLRIAFPVLMTNAMNWFFRETGEIRPALASGRTTDVPWDVKSTSELTTANLISPSGDVTLVTAEKSSVKLGPLPSTGVYRLTTKDIPEPSETNSDSETVGPIDLTTFDEDATLFAVNLASENESDLRLPELPESDAGQLPPAGRSPWFYLILAACGLVLAEWALFQRRVVA